MLDDLLPQEKKPIFIEEEGSLLDECGAGKASSNMKNELNTVASYTRLNKVSCETQISRPIFKLRGKNRS